jgi:nucleoside phosphorylase
MPGICAGIRGEANLGDVVFANLSWDYQSGKHFLTGEKLPGFALDPHPILADPSISSRIDQLASDQGFWVSLMRGWAVPTEVIPRLHSAPMGSGAAVLADGEFAGRVRAQQRKALGIDMEVYGLYCAAEYAGLPRPLVFSMKAVCDFADEQKSDSQQHYAAYMSANAVKEFLERYAEQLLRT